MSEAGYSLAELAEQLDLQCVGDEHLRIVGLATLSSAKHNQLSFLANPKYQQALSQTTAGAVIVSPQMQALCPTAALISDNPYLSYAKATRLFKRANAVAEGVHPSAVVAASATIAAGVRIAANVVIGEGASIGEDTILGPGCVIGDGVIIGSGCVLHANVSIYADVHIGNSVTLHSGCVIGADGFGFAPSRDGWQKIEQLGSVVIGDRVEIGANTSVDRGALDDTVIGNNVIIDNLVQIAHNVVIGEGTAIAGCTAIAGSTTIGKHCTIAGGVGVVGHIHLVDKVHVTAMTLVTKSIDKPGSYSSGTPMMETKLWHKAAVRFSQLNSMAKQLSALLKIKNN